MHCDGKRRVVLRAPDRELENGQPLATCPGVRWNAGKVFTLVVRGFDSRPGYVERCISQSCFVGGAGIAELKAIDKVNLSQPGVQASVRGNHTPSWKWGISSVGRALVWHTRGDRFETGILHVVQWGSSSSGRAVGLHPTGGGFESCLLHAGHAMGPT